MNIIEQGNYYRVREEEGKYFPEFINIRGEWLSYCDENGFVVVLNSPEEVKAFWQKKEF